LLARFLAARLGPLRWLEALGRLLLPLRLDTAQRAAQLLKLTFVSDFLPFGDLYEFKHFIHLVVQILQRCGNEHRVFDRLGDGGRCSGTKISRFYPLALRRRNAWRRLRRAFFAAVIPARFTAHVALRWASRRQIGSSLSCRFRFVRFRR